MIAIFAAVAVLAAAPSDITVTRDSAQVRVDVSALSAGAAHTAIFEAARQACDAAEVDLVHRDTCVADAVMGGMRQYRALRRSATLTVSDNR